jgi:A/G-specific adenine glycosylase
VEFCGGARHGTAESFPVKKPKKARKTEEMTVFLLFCDGKVALQKRPDSGLLAGLWQFPNVPGVLNTEAALETVGAMGLRPREVLRQTRRQHIFTHIQWEMEGYYLEVAEPAGDFAWRTAEEIEKENALPTAFRQFWEKK